MPRLRHRYRDPITLFAPITWMPFHSPIVRAVAALSLTQLIGWGTTFYLPAVIGPAIARELDIGLPIVMAGPTIMLVMMAVTSWPLGGMIERHGTRPIMTLGSALGAAGLMTLGLTDSPVFFFLSWMALGLAGTCMLTTPAQIAVSEIAGPRAHRALGILILAGGLTSTIVWPLTGLLQDQWGWRATTLLFAALMLFVCAPLHWTTLARQPREKLAKKAAREPAPIHGPSFALLAASFAANGFVTWGFALTIIILLEAAGLDHASALAAAAFIGIARWVGRMVDFLGGRRCSGFTIGLTGSALFPLSFAVLLLSNSFTGAMLFATLYGIASGITAVTRATLPLQIFPTGTYARASARLGVPLNLSYAAAPPLFTTVVTYAGPQAALWLAMVISCIAYCTLLGLLRVHRRVNDISQPN